MLVYQNSSYKYNTISSIMLWYCKPASSAQRSLSIKYKFVMYGFAHWCTCRIRGFVTPFCPSDSGRTVWLYDATPHTHTHIHKQVHGPFLPTCRSANVKVKSKQMFVQIFNLFGRLATICQRKQWIEKLGRTVRACTVSEPEGEIVSWTFSKIET